MHREYNYAGSVYKESWYIKIYISSELLRRMIMLKKEFARMIEELDYDVEPVYVKNGGG